MHVNEIYEKLINSDMLDKKALSDKDYQKIGLKFSDILVATETLLYNAVHNEDFKILPFLINFAVRYRVSLSMGAQHAVMTCNDNKIIALFLKNDLLSLTDTNRILALVGLNDNDIIDILADKIDPTEITHPLMFELSRTNDYAFRAIAKKGNIKYLMANTPMPWSQMEYLYQFLTDASANDNEFPISVIRTPRISKFNKDHLLELFKKDKDIVKVAMLRRQEELIPDALKKVFLIKDKK